MKKNYLIIAYACEDEGSEPGVGYHWSKTICNINKKGKTILITRKNNNVSKLTKNSNTESIGIDLPFNLLFIKRIIGIQFYYLLWTFLVFFHLIWNFRQYKNYTIHHITFTPIYYPPIYLVLPFQYVWGPIGGGESFPLSYLNRMKYGDIIKEISRNFLKYSIYINPVFYLACINSKRIICSTKETSLYIPSIFKDKIIIELMVMDIDKIHVESPIKKTIVIANRLINWKMTELFVESFHEYISNNKCDYKLIIIGNGPYLDRIKKFTKNKQISHVNRFKKRSDMLTTLKESSLFVSMSLRDSGAASLLEAISYNIPFLITNSGAHQSFLDGGLGFGFYLEDFKSDKKKIIFLLSRILNDENILKEERKKVKEFYLKHYCEKEKYYRIKSMVSERSTNN